MTVGELKTVLNKFDDETKIGIVNKPNSILFANLHAELCVLDKATGSVPRVCVALTCEVYSEWNRTGAVHRA